MQQPAAINRQLFLHAGIVHKYLLKMREKLAVPQCKNC